VTGLRRRLAEDERGTTMMEMVVGMTIMAIFMSMFTTAIFMMTRTANKVQSVTGTASQVNQAFLKLDKLVRYSSAVSTPGTGTGGDKYVELRFTNTGSESCTQLRFDGTKQQLQQRSWTVNSSGNASTASAWLPVASSISSGSFTQPTDPAALYQQLTVSVSATAGSTQSSTTTNAMTFTALNSNLSQTGSVCGQQGRP
jgi:hypothetical protein